MARPTRCAASLLALAALAPGCSIPLAAASGPERPRPGQPTPPSAAVRQLRLDLAKVFHAPIMARGFWAVDVRSLDTGEQLFALNADKLMMPASNMKVVTLATVAEVLGWDYQFTTTLEAAAPLEAGVLRGDLFVRGTGDPTINQREGRAGTVLAEWINALRAAGVREIEGGVIGDDEAFDDEGLGPGWSWDYLQFGYAAPVGALQFNENVAPLTVAPGSRVGDPAIVSLPAGAGLTTLNRATTGPADSAESIEFRRLAFTPTIEITGTVPAGGAAATRQVAVVNPTLYLAASVRTALCAAGIQVRGQAADIDDAAADVAGQRRVLGLTKSPPLRDIGAVLMKVSQNLYAETLVKALGASGGGIGTIDSGRQSMSRTLTSWGISEDAFVISDGSGLSRYNYISASALTTVLERMYRDPRHRDEFVATFPLAGREGTISARMRRTLAEGNALAKTGSIANVRALSGYVRTREGETLVFSILANDFVIPAATVNWIADLAVQILAAFTRR